MGIADLLGKWIMCPECRNKAAKVFLGKVKCSDVSCKNYDSQLVVPAEMLLKKAEAKKIFEGDFNPGVNSLTVSYRNYLGRDGTFEIDKASLIAKAKGDFVSARVVPTGKRITLKKKFIKNWKEIDDCLIRQARAEQGPDITVKYRNFKGKEMLFVGDSGSIRLVGDRISILVKSECRGGHKWSRRFILRKDRIENFSQIEKYL